MNGKKIVEWGTRPSSLPPEKEREGDSAIRNFFLRIPPWFCRRKMIPAHIKRDSIARGGQALMQSSQALHFDESKITSIVFRLINRDPVGQTAVQAPQ